MDDALFDEKNFDNSYYEYKLICLKLNKNIRDFTCKWDLIRN